VERPRSVPEPEIAPCRLTFVLWDGTLGGAESLSLELARRTRELGGDAVLSFIKDAGPLSDRARRYAVPVDPLRFAHGRDVVLRARRYAAAVAATEPDLVICMSVNHLAWGLRLGGYRGALVAVEHGELLSHEASGIVQRRLRRVDRSIAARLIDAEVSVSGFIRDRSLRVPHARRLVTIANGVDVGLFSPDTDRRVEAPITFGFAGRLIPGKGVGGLIDAFERVRPGADVRLRIAGDGPERTRLERRAAAGPAASAIEFCGSVTNMPEFWRAVDVGVAPSDTFIESFGMSPLEAMACGRPAIVTRNGGFVDLVSDAVTGSVVEPHDPASLEGALREYLARPTISQRGHAARQAVVARFSLDACLRGYVQLARTLTVEAGSRPRASAVT
jgi:glycosyltransferase involved in cell wall biosynthesis